jgi:hypothetical protein
VVARYGSTCSKVQRIDLQGYLHRQTQTSSQAGSVTQLRNNSEKDSNSLVILVIWSFIEAPQQNGATVTMNAVIQAMEVEGSNSSCAAEA